MKLGRMDESEYSREVIKELSMSLRKSLASIHGPTAFIKIRKNSAYYLSEEEVEKDIKTVKKFLRRLDEGNLDSILNLWGGMRDGNNNSFYEWGRRTQIDLFT